MKYVLAVLVVALSGCVKHYHYAAQPQAPACVYEDGGAWDLEGNVCLTCIGPDPCCDDGTGILTGDDVFITSGDDLTTLAN